MVIIDDKILIESSGNLVLQVNRSHLERISEFLFTHCHGGYHCVGGVDTNNSQYNVRIVATQKSTVSKSCSLLFLHAKDGLAFITHLTKKHKFILLSLNKVYFIPEDGGSIISGDFTDSDGARNDKRSIDHYLFNKLLELRTRHQQHTARHNASSSNPTTTLRSVVVKVEVFPSKLQHRVVAILTKLLDDNSIPEIELDISPSNNTHTLSLIQMDDAKASKTMKSHTFLVGITPADQSTPVICPRESSGDDNICRAYNKLLEVFERYRHLTKNPSFPFSHTTNKLVGSKRKMTCTTKPRIAVDCGSAPGGWTKYLMEQTACDEVYAIDPGDMDESVLSLPGVHHMKMTAARAIPQLREVLVERDEKIALWVSDMCVHDIPQQVDMFQSAYKQGMFEKSNAAFVLTIKCNKGHGRERFDMLVEEEASRLRQMGTYGMITFHLFSNRIGERTISGFIG